MGAFWKGTSTSAQAATVGNSLRFRASASAYLSRAYGAYTNASKFTYSLWVKRGLLGTSGYGQLLSCGGSGNDWGGFYFYSGYNGTDDLVIREDRGGPVNFTIGTQCQLRDPSAWYHITLVWDSAHATQAYRRRIYINGVEQTLSVRAGVDISSSQAWYMTTGSGPIVIGKPSYTTSPMLDGYLAQVCFVDGQALTPSAFAGADATTGEWKPLSNAQIRTNVVAAGGWGNNGFMLLFNDTPSSTQVYDRKTSDTATSGNNWTCNNIGTSGVACDWMLDSPTNASSGTQPAGNYPVINPLYNSTVSGLLSWGNLRVSVGAIGQQSIPANISLPTSGKYYWEVVNLYTSTGSEIGLMKSDFSEMYYSGYCRYAGTIRCNNVSVWSGLGSANSGDVEQFAYDADSGSLWIGRNNTWYQSNGTTSGAFSSGQPTATSVPVGMYPGMWKVTSNDIFDFNFGQRPFAYTPPTGFKALCTSNLPAPTITKSSQHFDVLAYTGSGAVKNVGQTGATPSFGYPSTVYSSGMINNSIRFRSSVSAKLQRTCGAASSTTVWTYSLWVKRGKLGGGHTLLGGGTDNSNNAWLGFDNNDRLDFYNYVSSSITARLTTLRTFKDSSRWHHLIFVSNGASGLKLYVDGVEVKAFVDSSGSNTTSWLLTSGTIGIGCETFQGSNGFDGYLSQVCFVDGQALTPTVFGQFDSTYSEVWKPLSSSQTRTNVGSW